MDVNLFWSIIIICAGLQLVLGLSYFKSSVKLEEYFLSGRNVGLFALTLTFIATQVGGGVVVGSAEAAYKYGVISILYSGGLGLGFIALSLGFARKLREMDVATVPQILKKFYSSNVLKNLASIILVISNFLILGALSISTRKLFSSVEPNNDLIFIGIWLCLILYTSIGGLKAVISTDILQITFIILVFIFVGYEISTIDNLNISWELNSDAKLIEWDSWIIAPMLIVIIGQDMGQRCFSSKNGSVASWAAFISSFSMVAITILPVILGIIAKQMNNDSVSSEQLVQLVSSLTSPKLGSFFACAILMAIVSTADSLLCAITSNISIDFNLSHKFSKIISLFIGALSIFISYLDAEIIPLMIVAYKIVICTLTVPIIAAVVVPRYRIHFLSPYISCIIGILCVAMNIPHVELFSLLLCSATYYFLHLIKNLRST